MKTIDLRTHSLHSDGADTPAEVVRRAHAAGLSAIALSDHDCVSGVEEAMAEGERIGVEVVPAIEFSVQSETETHILGYYIDIDSPILKTYYFLLAAVALWVNDLVFAIKEKGLKPFGKRTAVLAAAAMLAVRELPTNNQRRK